MEFLQELILAVSQDLSVLFLTPVLAFQVVFFGYFLGLNGGYIILNILSLFSITRYMRRHFVDSLPHIYGHFEPPVSLIVPAFNESATLATTVRSLLQLDYSEFEVIVVNDGSTDDTLETLIEAFSLKEFPEAYRVRLVTRDVLGVYVSTEHPNLKVITKLNGGKADALNAGINIARYPLFCGVDADSILQPDAVRRVVQPFIEDERTIACGGTVRIANGSRVAGGVMEEPGLPKNMLALFQIVEYLRAFLFGRLGWSVMNSLLIISGAFGIFSKETVIAAGGYRSRTVGEDMELVVRLHRYARKRKMDYAITFVPDPICWTEGPEDLGSLKKQRIRWQRGLTQSLWLNVRLMTSPSGGVVGRVAFPFMLVFEWFGPVIEVAGYVFFITGLIVGFVSPASAAVFFGLAVGLGVLLSLTALLLEELSFHMYPRPRQLVILFLAAVAENFGYRQLTSFWRLAGVVQSLLFMKADWGRMRRTGTWHDGIATRAARRGQETQRVDPEEADSLAR